MGMFAGRKEETGPPDGSVKRRSRTSISPWGCLIMSAGLLFCATGYGIIVGLPILIVGGVIGVKKIWRCGRCGTVLADNRVTICPACKFNLTD